MKWNVYVTAEYQLVIEADDRKEALTIVDYMLALKPVPVVVKITSMYPQDDDADMDEGSI